MDERSTRELVANRQTDPVRQIQPQNPRRRQAIVVDKEGVIICGHTRLLAAKKLGLTQVPVHAADNFTPAQVKASRLRNNRTQDETSFDLELNGPELEELKGLDFDLALTGLPG